jgi:hypothetical protein
MQPFQVTAVSVDAERQGDGGKTSKKTSHIEESDVPLWLQFFDEGAVQLLAEEKD